MEKEYPSIVTKAFATDYDDYITKLSSEVNVEQVGTQPVDFMASGWKDPNIHGVKDTSAQSFANGRIVFARALVEVSADKELKHEVVMGVPLENGTGHKIERMRVEYEWKSPLCLDCHIFSHSNGQCPKRVLENVKEVPQTQEDGFTLVTKKKNKGKSIASNTGRKIEGVKFNKPKTNVMWSKKANQPVTNPKVADTNLATLKNKFLALQNDVPDVAESSKAVGDNTNRGSNMGDDESEVEEVFAEADPKLKGASTPSPVDRNV
ncbi:RNA-directed DNA polymerase, eukaryota, reverse transcriptase zinc-binding domain protein [Tanacetum coccineum]